MSLKKIARSKTFWFAVFVTISIANLGFVDLPGMILGQIPVFGPTYVFAGSVAAEALQIIAITMMVFGKKIVR